MYRKEDDMYINTLTVVFTNMLYLHPYLGKIPMLTNMFQMGSNHQLPLDPKTMNNEGFRPSTKGVITPKNEGFGFPW